MIEGNGDIMEKQEKGVKELHGVIRSLMLWERRPERGKGDGRVCNGFFGVSIT